MTYLKKNKLNIIAIILMFVALFVFFAYVHPLIIWDTDDWKNIVWGRAPWPVWKTWNPIKVLPETLMPVAGYIAAYCVNPFVGDYINSITYVSAFLVSISITIAVTLLGICTAKALDLSEDKAYIFAVISCLLGFSMFKPDPNGSTYLFHAHNVTCYYHYIVPALLNTSLVFYMMIKEDFPRSYVEMSAGEKGIFVLLCYLAICSNLFHSVILATYSGLQILYEFFRCKGVALKMRILENVKRCYVYYGIVLFWLAILPFEAFGGRARSVKLNASIWELPFIAFKNLVKSVHFNRFFPIYVGLLIVGIGIVCCKNRDIRILRTPRAKKAFIDAFLCAVLVTVYLIVLSARLNGGYINRVDVQISFGMFLLAILSFMLAIVIKEIGSVRIFLPLLVFFMLMNVLDGRYPFEESTTGNVNPITCKSIDDNIIEQIQAADKSGQTEMNLRVPRYKPEDNWPHAVYASNRIRHTLYLHGLISRNDIKVKMQPVLTERQLGTDPRYFYPPNITSARIDIKNSGSEANDVEVLEISDADAKVDSPKWMRGNGMGRVISTRKGSLSLKLKCRGDGTLSTILRGADARDSSNKRIPVWVRYSKLVVDGKVLFDEVRPTCHDKPQKFTMNVKDGQVVDVLIEWDPDDITIGDIAEEVQERKDAPKAPKPTQASKTIDLNLVSYARVDIKNAGTEKNDVEVARVSDAKAIVESPKWMRARDGNGRMIKTDSGTLALKLKCTGDGDLTINLRGADFRGADGKRVPVWINYKKLTVDGKVIFSAVKPTCHDRPQKFTMKVKDGQTVDVKVEWVPDCVTVGRGMDQVVKSNEKVAQKQSEQIKSLKSDLKKANAEKTRFAAKLKKLNATNKKLQSQLKEIRSGWWYKVFHRLKLVG